MKLASSLAHAATDCINAQHQQIQQSPHLRKASRTPFAAPDDKQKTPDKAQPTPAQNRKLCIPTNVNVP